MYGLFNSIRLADSTMYSWLGCILDVLKLTNIFGGSKSGFVTIEPCKLVQVFPSVNKYYCISSIIII